jgi:hypothetical protein
MSNLKQWVEVNYMESTKQVSGIYSSDLKNLNMVYLNGQFLAHSYFHYT